MKSNSSGKNHVCIIGSGIGGLSTGIVLLKLGYDVTIVEKNRDAGGLMRSYTRKGIECSTGIHYMGSLLQGQILRKFFDYLDVTESIPVKQMGSAGIIDRYIFKQDFFKPEIFDVPQGIDAYEDNLNRHFPKNQTDISHIADMLRDAEEQLHSLKFLHGSEFDLSLLDQPASFGELLHQLKCPPQMKAILSIPSHWLGVPIDNCPPFLLTTTLASYLSSSWRLACSGTDMANVFIEKFTALGGNLITGEAVEEIIVESRIIKGVSLHSKKKIMSSLVIGAVHPKVILEMLPHGAVKPSYKKRIAKLENTQGYFCVHAEVNSSTIEEIPYNIFKIESDQNGNVPDLKYYQIKNCEKKDKKLLTILTDGNPEVWAKWKDTHTGKRGKEYKEEKTRLAQALINEAIEDFDGLTDVNIIDAYTPLTIRDWVNSPEGSAYGVKKTSKQLFSAAVLNRTSVKGLYLAGQSIMAPGVLGTLMGTFKTIKHIIGNERFNNEITF